MSTVVIPADQLPEEIVELSDRLLAALAKRLGPDITKGTVYVEIGAHDGRMQWLKPIPKLTRGALRITLSE